MRVACRLVECRCGTAPKRDPALTQHKCIKLFREAAFGGVPIGAYPQACERITGLGEPKNFFEQPTSGFGEDPICRDEWPFSRVDLWNAASLLTANKPPFGSRRNRQSPNQYPLVVSFKVESIYGR
jgi:hypothetical protein